MYWVFFALAAYIGAAAYCTYKISPRSPRETKWEPYGWPLLITLEEIYPAPTYGWLGAAILFLNRWKQDITNHLRAKREFLWDHQHSWFCFESSECRQLEHELKRLQSTIDRLDSCLAELEDGITTQTLVLLNEYLRKTNMGALEIVERLTRMPPPTLSTVNTFSPIVWRAVYLLYTGLKNEPPKEVLHYQTRSIESLWELWF